VFCYIDVSPSSLELETAEGNTTTCIKRHIAIPRKVTIKLEGAIDDTIQ
jgi:hypothetical protein